MHGETSGWNMKYEIMTAACASFTLVRLTARIIRSMLAFSFSSHGPYGRIIHYFLSPNGAASDGIRAI